MVIFQKSFLDYIQYKHHCQRDSGILCKSLRVLAGIFDFVYILWRKKFCSFPGVMDQRRLCGKGNSSRSWECRGTMSQDKPDKGAPPSAVEGVDWRERCLSLEASLQQFKSQVVRIRETLGEKVGHTDRNCTGFIYWKRIFNLIQ